MISKFFADTSYYVAFLNDRDRFHQRACELTIAYDVPMITTEYVLLEVANFYTKPTLRSFFLALEVQLRTASHVTVLPASPRLWSRGLALFAARPDKEWSLTDCISFEVMTDRGLTDALTADHHFTQAGFNALLI